MPSREQHMKNDVDKAGLRRPMPEVHQLLDQFAHYPDMEFLRRHRKFLHHKEGIEYMKMRFGEDGEKAARQHVLDDCGHIPDAIDYYIGTVDEFGYKKKFNDNARCNPEAGYHVSPHRGCILR